jgi:hypothetical protein
MPGLPAGRQARAGIFSPVNENATNGQFVGLRFWRLRGRPGVTSSEGMKNDECEMGLGGCTRAVRAEEVVPLNCAVVRE